MESVVMGPLQTIQQPIIQSFEEMGFWISMLEVSTTILASFFTIALAVIALLTWRQIELRKKAEKEVGKIIKLGDDMKSLEKLCTQLVQEVRETVPETKKALGILLKGATEVKLLASEIKEKDADIDKIMKQIQGKAQAMEKSLDSLTTISGHTTGDVVTEAKMDVLAQLLNPLPKVNVKDAAKSALVELLSTAKVQNDREVVSEALKKRSEE